MSSFTEVPPAQPVALGAGPARERAAGRERRLALLRGELVALMALAAVLNFVSLARNGWANEYYSATVRSMASSWHAFLYASFDPTGVMTVDKPPLALWLQALSVRVFGFHPASLLVPQALMGIASVALVYDLTRRVFGRAGGFIAGLALATTPITVAISRHNNPDALLVLCCVAALWFAVRAFQDGRTRWLVASGLCVGLGFETKMAVALMVVPGIAVAWLWLAPRGRLAALRQLLAGGVALVVAGGAWPVLVALTPAADRPWISGTSDNSILSLILGYNGLGRLAGQSGEPQGAGAGGPAGGGVFGGSAGPLRLLDASLGGQAGWLVGFALVAGVAILAASRLSRADARTGWLIAVGGTFLTTGVAFSSAQGIFHPYYVSLLAPFTAALVGAGAATLVRWTPIARVMAPLALAAGLATELVVLHNDPGAMTSWRPVLIALSVLAALALVVASPPRVRYALLAAGLAALLAAPASWAIDTLGHATSGTFPAGGPQAASFGAGGPRGFGGAGGFPAAGGGGGGMFGGQSLSRVLAYVRAHGGGTLAVSSQSGAAASIIATGAHVAGIGGFSGRESEVTVAWLAREVQAGRLRWVLSDGRSARGFGGDTRAGATAALAAVARSCRAVPSPAGTSVSGTLYDCRGQGGALLALAGSAS